MAEKSSSGFSKLSAERIATGFHFTEGPVWHPPSRSLLFSDIPGNTLYRWTDAGGAAVFRRPSGKANGNIYDREDRLVSCEHENRRVSRTRDDGSVETLTSHYDGKRLNSPNDVVCAANGELIFTDPPYGLRQPDGSFAGEELPFRGVYRLSSSLKLIADDFELPNGLALSADGARLYIADTEFARLRHKEHTGRPDGVKLDARGYVYVAAHEPKAIWVFSPSGELAGFIDIGEAPANLAWGGEDGRMLFVTANTSLYRVRMQP